MDVGTILTGFGTGAGLALSFFIKKKFKSSDPATISYPKLAATVFVGGCIGVANSLRGSSLTESGFYVEVAAYTGVIVYLENSVKTVVRLANKWLEK